MGVYARSVYRLMIQNKYVALLRRSVAEKYTFFVL